MKIDKHTDDSQAKIRLLNAAYELIGSVPHFDLETVQKAIYVAWTMRELEVAKEIKYLQDVANDTSQKQKSVTEKKE